MAFKINIGTKEGKTYKVEESVPGLIDRSLGETIDGKEIKPEFKGYEFEITGASDSAGFPSKRDVDGQILKRVMLKYGFGMHVKPRREGKKPQHDKKPRGLRLRKTVRGKVITDAVTQINLKVLKVGKKPLAEIFAPTTEEKPTEVPAK